MSETIPAALSASVICGFWLVAVSSGTPLSLSTTSSYFISGSANFGCAPGLAMFMRRSLSEACGCCTGPVGWNTFMTGNDGNGL